MRGAGKHSGRPGGWAWAAEAEGTGQGNLKSAGTTSAASAAISDEEALTSHSRPCYLVSRTSEVLPLTPDCALKPFLPWAPPGLRQAAE